ncbi:RHS repeat-associated core domain-containing protein [Humibacter albus]|uniref:RHS repeat-associated core domain-containing protein n=1 Tax=Humibacter albus TaxID=427754 RepID=UPI0012F8F064
MSEEQTGPAHLGTTSRARNTRAQLIRHPNGLTELGTRYYDSSIGRFRHRDPSGQETNGYNYVTRRGGRRRGRLG